MELVGWFSIRVLQCSQMISKHAAEVCYLLREVSHQYVGNTKQHPEY